MIPADRDSLLDLLMTVEAEGHECENLGELVDWLIRERAKAERDRQRACVRLLELGAWWRTVRDLHAELGRDAFVFALFELIDDEARP